MKAAKIVVLLLLGSLAVIYFVGCQSTALTSAKLYIQQENYPKALEQLEIEVKQNPQNAEGWYLLGYVYAMEGRFEDMNRAFAECQKLTNQYDKDIQTVRRKYWIDKFNSGVRKLQAEKFEDAIKDFETAVLIDPEDPNAYKNLGYAFIKIGKDDKAVENYELALKYDSTDTKTMYVLGLEYQRMGNYEKAAQMFQKILDLEPGNADALSNLALTYDMMGEPQRAMSAYNQALAHAPDNPDLYFNRGLLYYKRDDFIAAAKDFEKVLEYNPEDFEALFYAGSAYLNMGDKIKQERMKLEEQGKSNSEIEKLKAQEKELYKKALQYLEKARDVKPDDINVWNNLGITYVRLGMTQKGVEAFKKVEELQKELK